MNIITLTIDFYTGDDTEPEEVAAAVTEVLGELVDEANDPDLDDDELSECRFNGWECGSAKVSNVQTGLEDWAVVDR